MKQASQKRRWGFLLLGLGIGFTLVNLASLTMALVGIGCLITAAGASLILMGQLQQVAEAETPTDLSPPEFLRKELARDENQRRKDES